MSTLDFSNKNFQTAASFIQYTQEFIFLTGKAGTGKTTFLKYIKDRCGKKYVLTAPTGVAAINAGGVTLHSFFQLPIGTFIADYRKSWGEEDQYIINKHQLLAKLRINSTKRKLMRELELLIIDEISMVRADTLDAVDQVLRHIRNRYQEPFGGVQLLFIGDLYQLPPVVRNSELQILSQYYNSPFFFDALALKEQAPICVELDKIYRQEDRGFIRILNHIRNNEMEQDDYEALQERYVPGFVPDGDAGVITLTSHNAQASEINQNELIKLRSPEEVLKARVSGDFPDNAYPIEEELTIKVGAQVMFIKNDKGENRRFYNGKIGQVNRINKVKNEIEIYFPKEKDTIIIQPEKWENIRYQLNESNNKIEEDVIGTFEQFPFRLAWAVTIHKSQGLTFDEAVVDAGKSFAPGQVYVALSRLTSLKGLVLRSKITPQSVIVDQRIIDYMNKKRDADLWDDKLQSGKSEFLRNTLLMTFQWSDFIQRIELYLEESVSVLTQDVIVSHDHYRTALLKWRKLESVGRDFAGQLHILFVGKKWDKLLERIQAAKEWMVQQLVQSSLEPLEQWQQELKVQKGGAKAAVVLRFVLLQLKLKIAAMEQAEAAAEELTQTGDTGKALERLKGEVAPVAEEKEVQKEKAAEKPVSSAYTTYEMFKNRMSIEEIVQKRRMVRSTISGHLTDFILTGQVSPADLMPMQRMYDILDIIKQNPADKLGDLKQKLGEHTTYEEIKWTLAYHKYQKSLEEKPG